MKTMANLNNQKDDSFIELKSYRKQSKDHKRCQTHCIEAKNSKVQAQDYISRMISIKNTSEQQGSLSEKRISPQQVLVWFNAVRRLKFQSLDQYSDVILHHFALLLLSTIHQPHFNIQKYIPKRLPPLLILLILSQKVKISKFCRIYQFEILKWFQSLAVTPRNQEEYNNSGAQSLPAHS